MKGGFSGSSGDTCGLDDACVGDKRKAHNEVSIRCTDMDQCHRGVVDILPQVRALLLHFVEIPYEWSVAWLASSPHPRMTRRVAKELKS